jgi:hypothetical protein
VQVVKHVVFDNEPSTDAAIDTCKSVTGINTIARAVANDAELMCGSLAGPDEFD